MSSSSFLCVLPSFSRELGSVAGGLLLAALWALSTFSFFSRFSFLPPLPFFFALALSLLLGLFPSMLAVGARVGPGVVGAFVGPEVVGALFVRRRRVED